MAISYIPRITKPAQDEAWADARYFLAARMAELCDSLDGAVAEEEASSERRAEWLVMAKRAIENSLEPADGLEAA